MSKVGPIIKQRRKQLNLTLLDIAKRVGVSEATVQRWESGNIKNLRHENIIALANAIELSPAQLMGWDDPQEKDTPPSHFLNDDAKELAQKMYERPELRVLFSSAKDVKKEDLEFVNELLKKMNPVVNEEDISQDNGDDGFEPDIIPDGD